MPLFALFDYCRPEATGELKPKLFRLFRTHTPRNSGNFSPKVDPHPATRLNFHRSYTFQKQLALQKECKVTENKQWPKVRILVNFSPKENGFKPAYRREELPEKFQFDSAFSIRLCFENFNLMIYGFVGNLSLN